MSIFIHTFSKMSFAKDVSWHQYAPSSGQIFKGQMGCLKVSDWITGVSCLLPYLFNIWANGCFDLFFPFRKRTVLVKICLFITIISTIWKLMQKEHIKKTSCQTLMSWQSPTKDTTLHFTDSTTQKHNWGLNSLPYHFFPVF